MNPSLSTTTRVKRSPLKHILGILAVAAIVWGFSTGQYPPHLFGLAAALTFVAAIVSLFDFISLKGGDRFVGGWLLTYLMATIFLIITMIAISVSR